VSQSAHVSAALYWAVASTTEQHFTTKRSLCVRTQKSFGTSRFCPVVKSRILLTMTLNLRLWFSIASIGLLSGCATPASKTEPAPGGWGRFSGPVRAEWHGDRKMRLLDDVKYVEPDGKEWLAPKGSIIDGASIPRGFWSLVGGPFEGGYRDASVIHDVACDRRDAKWEDVHSMFYRAMRASGVGRKKAKILFTAVWHYGPRWSAPPTGLIAVLSPKPAASSPEPPTKNEVRAVQKWVAKEDPGPKEISLAPEVPGTLAN
jgi:Protein of unknown function (DUF1353)